jgi:hypothetical protein
MSKGCISISKADMLKTTPPASNSADFDRLKREAEKAGYGPHCPLAIRRERLSSGNRKYDMVRGGLRSMDGPSTPPDFARFHLHYPWKAGITSLKTVPADSTSATADAIKRKSNPASRYSGRIRGRFGRNIENMVSFTSTVPFWNVCMDPCMSDLNEVPDAVTRR